jgi:hypothetical protein
MDKKQWQIADLIDLELFLNQDEGEDLDTLAVRDREIYTSLPTAVKEENSQNNTALLLHGWLTKRREQAVAANAETPLPGESWQELFFLFILGSILAGLVSGAGLAFSFLSYSGTAPVNVSAYFGVFVLLQLLLFLLLLLSFFYQRFQGRSGLESSVFFRLFRRLFSSLFSRALAGISRKGGAASSAESRLKWSARSASIKRLQQRYGILFLRPFFMLAQLFGVSFNVGVLAATLLKVIGSDLAFGWQTTLQVSSASVHGLVGWISLPWFWLPEYCIPSLASIEGSKLILKDGIYHLATRDLTSWWPFLCFSVFFYGLLPRLVLLLAGWVRQRRELASLNVEYGSFRQIIHRMQTPQVSTAADQEPRAESPVSQPDSGGQAVQAEQESRIRQEKQGTKLPVILGLIPDELFADCSLPELRQQVRQNPGYELSRVLPFWSMDQSEDQELAAIQEAVTGAKDILLLQEAWQPPIQELFSFLSLLRSRIGDQPLIIIALIGKPESATILTPVNEQNLRTWQQKIGAVRGSDPGLQLVELFPS